MSLTRLKSSLKASGDSSQVTFWFVRHSESEENTKGDGSQVMHDTPLTPQGQDESASIVRYLKEEGITVARILTAPTARSTQTADIIARENGLEVEVVPGLTERDWGDWKNLPWRDVAEKLKGMDIQERHTFVPPNGESWQQMDERLLQALENIALQVQEGDDVLIITHRGCLRAILPILAKASREQHEEYSVPLASLSKLSFEREAFDFVGHRPHQD